MSMLRPAAVDVDEVELDELLAVVEDSVVVEDVPALVVGGVVGAGTGDPLEQAAMVSAVAATTAPKERRRILRVLPFAVSPWP